MGALTSVAELHESAQCLVGDLANDNHRIGGGGGGWGQTAEEWLEVGRNGGQNEAVGANGGRLGALAGGQLNVGAVGLAQ